jgi:hypothetical protein
VAANGTDPAALAAVTVASFGGGVFLVAFRRPAIKWATAHAQRSFGDVLGIAVLVLAYVAIAVYLAARGNTIALVILAAAILGALSVPAVGLLVTQDKPSRTTSGSARREPANSGYIRLLFGGLLLLTTTLGLLLLVLVQFNVNPVVATAAVIVVGSLPIVALTIAGSMDLRQQGKLSEARTVDIVKAGIQTLNRLIPRNLLKK